MILAMAILGAALAQSEPATPADQTFIVQFSIGPSWTAGKPPQDQPRFQEHSANLARLRKEGRVSLGARFSDKGMIVVHYPTEAAARTEIAADPGVRAGTFVFDISELHTFYEGCLRRGADAAPPATAPSEALPPSVTLPPPLARVLVDYEDAWQKKDAAGLAALFADDGYVLATGAPPVTGRADIEKHYAGQGGPLSLRALAFAAHGSVGYIIGGFARAKGEPDIGKFTLTLRRGTRGRWLIVSDMDNGNTCRTGG